MAKLQERDAWIACARADAEWVEALAQRLGDEGLTVFYDELGPSKLAPGSARVNVVVLGPASACRPRPSPERRPPRLPGLRPADRHGLRAVALIPWARR